MLGSRLGAEFLSFFCDQSRLKVMWISLNEDVLKSDEKTVALRSFSNSLIVKNVFLKTNKQQQQIKHYIKLIFRIMQYHKGVGFFYCCDIYCIITCTSCCSYTFIPLSLLQGTRIIFIYSLCEHRSSCTGLS